MLTAIDRLDEINKLLCESQGWIALDLTNGNHLKKASKVCDEPNCKYLFIVVIKMTSVIWASSEKEAIAQANKGLI